MNEMTGWIVEPAGAGRLRLEPNVCLSNPEPETAVGRSILLLLFVLPAVAATAQQPTRVPPPVTDQSSPFHRLELPAPTTIRGGGGAPGPAYWQQRASYVIKATLDTLANRVSGEERITYANRSPDSLRYVWVQLEQNLFTSTSRGSRVFDQGSRWGTRGAEGGVTLKRVALVRSVARGRTVIDTLRYVVNGTLMRVDLPAPLAPGGTIVLDIAWSFPFGANANRMGVEQVDGGTIYEVAQWYPRMAVYDDVRGWNTEQYLGQGEFYLEYGKFDVSLTLPANMLVAATGLLQNPATVLTPLQASRLLQAQHSDSTIAIRGRDEVTDPASRPHPAGGLLTWHFTADSVRDFAWAAARHFIWDAAGANHGRTLVMSFYPPSADSIWRNATQYARAAIDNYSRLWVPYPYPVAANVNGVEGGMEYPMIVFCHNRTDGPALYSVTDHEFGHTWFPMMVGSNERLYPWMDEGFNTFQNYYAWKQRYPGLPNRRANPATYLTMALSGQEQPIMTPADRINPQLLGQVAYNKPGLGLVLLRDQIVGAERFDAAFREYIRRWSWKHPTPADFFRTMDDALGEDLSWFWHSWFYTTETLDQAVESVATSTDSTGQMTSRIFLRSVGPMVMPVVLDVTLDDSSVQRIRLPVEIWSWGDRYVAAVPGPRRITAVVVDPDNAFPDVNRTNNRWQGRR